MLHRTHYHTLMASLPYMPTSFEIQRVPISGPRLEDRFKMLSDEDKLIIKQLEQFLRWERQPREHTDEDVLQAYESILATIDYPLAKEIASHIMDIRILVAAIRRRLRDLPPPLPVGQWGQHITLYWQHPDFSLGVRYPWIQELQGLLSRRAVMAAHRLINQEIWSFLLALAQDHSFDFEAVMLYLVRWDVVNSWVTQDEELGKKRFHNLMEEALGDYARIFDAGQG